MDSKVFSNFIIAIIVVVVRDSSRGVRACVYVFVSSRARPRC